MKIQWEPDRWTGRQTDGGTDTGEAHDEVNSRFSQFCERS